MIVAPKIRYVAPDGSLTVQGLQVARDASQRLSALADLSGKQDTLFSGTNIRTVAGKSLLGSGNVDPGYIHEQVSPSAVWSITHNLGVNPTCYVTDTAGSICVGVVSYVSANSLTITFSAAFAGSARLI